MAPAEKAPVVPAFPDDNLQGETYNICLHFPEPVHHFCLHFASDAADVLEADPRARDQDNDVRIEEAVNPPRFDKFSRFKPAT